MQRDYTIKLNSRIENNAIQFFWFGKWRTVREYSGKKNPPAANVVNQSLSVFKLNAGMDKDQPLNLVWED